MPSGFTGGPLNYSLWRPVGTVGLGFSSEAFVENKGFVGFEW
jgi:hypothetical protein